MATFLVVAVICLRKKPFYSVLGIAVTIGYGCSFLSAPPDEIPLTKNHTATVTRISEASMSTRAIVSLQDGHKCYLIIPDRLKQPAPGDVISFHGEIKTPRDRKDIDTDISLNSFLYRNYTNICCVADSIEVLSHSGTLMWKFHAIREKIVDLIVNSGVNDNSVALLSAMLVGDTSMISDDTRGAMSKAGLAHILAISGLHVAIIAGILSLLLAPLSWMGAENVRRILTILLLWLYAAITGMSPSIVRAVIMITVVLIGRMTGRGGNTVNSLCLAAILIIIFDPRAIYAPGFQLTMIAVASISLISKIIPAFDLKSWWRHAIISWAIITVGATIGTSLVAIYYFHSFPTYFFIANIPIALVLPLLMVTGIGVVIFSLFGVDFFIIDRITDFLTEIVFKTSEIAISLPGGIIDNIYISDTGVIAGCLAIPVLIGGIYYKSRLLGVSGLLLATIPLLSTTLFRRPDNELFISRTSDATTIVIADRNGIYAKSTAKSIHQKNIPEILLSRHVDFFKLRNSTNVTMLEQHHKGLGWENDDRIIAFGKQTLAIINSNTDCRPAPLKINYAIIGQGYKGDIMELIEILKPDSLLLGTDVNPRRRKKMENLLRQNKVPFRSLSDNYGLYLKNL